MSTPYLGLAHDYPAPVLNPRSRVAAALAAALRNVSHPLGIAASAPRGRSRTMWSLGDSTAAGSPATAFADPDVGSNIATAKSAITLQSTQWQPWGLLASQGRWTLGGILATGGYTSAQIRDILLPQLLTLATPGDTVIVQAGTNGQVFADTTAIYDALRSAGLHAVAVTLAPSTASTVAAIEAFNAQLKSYCTANGIPIVDAYSLFADPVTAAYRTAYLADGVHPNAAGFQALGQLIATVLNGLLPTDPGLLIRHGAAFAAQKITKPLGGGTNGVDFGLFAALGTSTIATGSDVDFQGGQCYVLTRGDSNILADFAYGHPTLTAGRKYRIGLAVKTAIANGSSWQVLLESNTTGQRHLWGIGYPSYTQTGQPTIGRFFSDIVVPQTDTYRLRVSLSGVNGDVLKVGELTMLDLTALGL